MFYDNQIFIYKNTLAILFIYYWKQQSAHFCSKCCIQNICKNLPEMCDLRNSGFMLPLFSVNLFDVFLLTFIFFIYLADTFPK